MKARALEDRLREYRRGETFAREGRWLDTSYKAEDRLIIADPAPAAAAVGCTVDEARAWAVADLEWQIFDDAITEISILFRELSEFAAAQSAWVSQ